MARTFLSRTAARQLHRSSAFLIMIMLAGCLHAEMTSPPATVKRVQMQMGTLVQITAVAPTQAVAQQAVTAGFQEIRRLEELLSTWMPASELSRVNEAAGREPVKVSPDTLFILMKSFEMARLTDGGFNIAIGPAMEAWSVTEQQRIPQEAEVELVRPRVDLSH